MAEIIAIGPYSPIATEDGLMTQEMAAFVNLVANLSIIEGSGSPETVVSASVSRLYMDTAGSAGSILYIKRDSDIGGDDTQGWILV